jgi:hypothetical protein
MEHLLSAVRRAAAQTHLFLLTLLLVLVLPVQAQVAGTASIQGSVLDPSGAVLPNATIVLTNTATQVQRTATADSSGLYSFPNIDIGTYNMTVTAQGFQTYTRTGIVLEVGSNTAINVPMKVGAADVKIEVQSEGLALQTEDASFKQTIDQNAVTEMPLNGRQMTALITLSGGSSAAPGGDFTGSKYSYAAISVSIAGGMGNTTEWRLDGGDNNDWMANTNLPFPFPDAVTQFSVESTALGSQSGSHSGGLVNVVTRSGTNQFHGSGFEFIRNNYINARNFFSDKDSLHQNQYGFTFGGPVWLPHIYNGRDKLFFFTGFQFQKTTSASASSTTYVPTAANLAGDFSVTDPAPGAPTPFVVCGGVEQLYDPLTGAALPGNKYPSLPTWNAAALKLLPYLPKIVPRPDGSDQCGKVQYAIPNLINDKQFVTRVDYTINAKNNLYGRYFLDGYQQPAPYSPTNILVTTQSGNIERVQNFTIGENWTISSKLLNTVHATISRRVNNRGYNAADINLATLGVKAFQLVPNGLQLTVSTASKNHGFTIGGGTNSVSHFNDNAFSISDDLTWVKGKHQFVMGGEFLRNQLNISNAYESNGNGSFNGFYSSNGPTGTGACVSSGKPSQCPAGDANLDFLAGAQSGFEQSKQQQNALRAPIPSLYIQDTFHANSRVTVVGGLRWVPEFYPFDYFGRGSVFDYNAFLANKVSSVYPNAPAGAFFYGDAGIPKSFTKNSPWQFAPNVGLSIDPTGSGKTVLRGGFELAYDQVNFFTAQRNEQNPPNATASKPTASNMICFSEPWLIGTAGYGCNQTGAKDTSPYPQPQIATPATAIFPQQSQYIFITPQFHASRTVQWTASVQHDFPHGWQLQLQYIGNHTYHAPTGYPLSNAVFIPGVWGANGTGCDPIVKTGPAAVKPGAAGTPCSTTANAQSRYALTIANPSQGNGYTGAGGGTTLVGDWGTANYNGLVTTAQHRLSNSFSLLANYTYSKCLNINDASGDYAGTSVSDPKNYARDYGPCGSDYRHIENVSLVAKSNFGFGNRFERYLINNWEFAPLAHIVSGSVINVTQGSDESLTSNGNDRPNVVPGVPVYLHTAIRVASGASTRAYLNPLAFVNNTTQGTFGTVSRNAYRGKPNYEFDAQISRIFPLHERLALDLRLEAFNVLNHPNFKNPSVSNPGNPGSPNVTFGQITSANDPRIFQAAAKITF